MNLAQKAEPLTDENAAKTPYEDGIPTALIEVHGDKWCVLGDIRLPDLMDDALAFSKRQVFGFPLVK
jgi:hypothetical protein